MNMKAPALLSVALASTLLLAATRTDAIVTDNTSWVCTSTETLKVTATPKVVEQVSGIELSFDDEGNFTIYLPGPDAFYTGTVVEKGKTGFLGTPEPAAIDDLRDYVSDLVEFQTGAESANITTFTWTIKGKVKNGELKAVLKAKGKGSIVLSGRTRRGSGKLTEVIVGAPIT
jgi:hypothetical protein